MNDGNNPIKVSIEDEAVRARVESDDSRFAKHDVLVGMVHFIQKRTPKGGIANEYTVTDVLEHIAAPRQLKLIDDDSQKGDENDNP